MKGREKLALAFISASLVVLAVFPSIPSARTTGTHLTLNLPQTGPLVVSTPDFSLTTSTTSLTIAVGASQTVQVTATSLNGFTGTVYLSAFSYPPQVSLSPTSLTLTSGGSQSSTLTIAVPSGAIPGDYTVFLDATGGCSLSHFAEVSVTVTGPDFTITASKNPLTVSQTVSDTTDLNLASLDGFAGTVSIFAFSSDLMVTPSSASVSLTPGGTGTTTITVQPNPSTQPGNYTLSVDASSGTSHFHFLDITVIVAGPTFSMSTNRVFLTLVAGGASNSTTITVTPIGGFSGTVALTANPSFPSGVDGSLDTTSVTLPPSKTSTLTVSAPGSTASGFYTITVTGGSGSITTSLDVFITVKASDFKITSDPAFVALVAGSGYCQSTITAAGFNGFTGTIGLTEKHDTGLTVSITPSSVTVPASPTATLTVSADASMVPGFYNIKVNGTSGSVVHHTSLGVLVIGPDFQLAANPSSMTVTAGSNTMSTISLNSENGFTGIVSLTANAFGSGITATLGSATISGSETSTLTVSAVTGALPGNFYTVKVTGTSGSLTHSIYIPVTVVGPDFSMSASPNPVTFNAGSTATSTIAIVPTTGFSDPVDLSVSTTANLNASILPATVTSGSYSTTLSLNSTIPGVYTVDVTGSTGAGLFHDIVVTVTVQGPDFTLSASPSSLTISAGSSDTSIITVGPLHGFSSAVDLAATPSIGITAALSPTSIASPQTSTLTITIDPTVAPGAYSVDVVGTSGHLTHDVPITVNVSGFTLTANPTTLTIDQGATQDSIITVSAENGFNGVVQLTTQASQGLTANLNPTSVTGSGPATLALTAGSNMSPGTYLVNVTGTSGQLTQGVTIDVTVPTPDFAIGPQTPTTTPCTASVDCDTTITITPQNGFLGPVTFAVSAAVGLSCNQPGPVTGSGSTTLTCSATNLGDYTVSVTGSSGSLMHATGVITYHVVATPDFSLSAGTVSPSSILAGSSGTSIITVNPVGGFSGPISFTASTASGIVCRSPADWTGTQTPVLSCTSNTAGDYSVKVTGISTIGGLTVHHDTNDIAFHVVDFGIAANPTAVTVTTGTAGTSTITITAENQFVGTVALSTHHSECSLSPESVVNSGTSALTCTFASLGTITVTIAGTIAGSSHTATVTFTVNASPDFSISTTPGTVSFSTGATGSSTITVTPSNGFTGTVDLSATISPATGLIVGFSTRSLIYGAYGYGSSTASFSSSTPGSYTVSITGASGSITHIATVHVTVASPDFGVGVSPTTLTIQAGNSGSSTITVTPSNGFTGTVALTTSVSPSGPTVSLNTASITGGSGTSTLTISVGSAVTAGTYTITVRGASESLSHSATVTVTVTAVQGAASAPTILGLDPTVFYSIIGVIATIIVGGVALVIRGRTKTRK